MKSAGLCVLSIFFAAKALAGEIHEAAARGDLATVTRLAAAGPAVRASTDQEGFTALHQAVIHRQPQIVAALLAAGAPVDARDRGGQTPLHHLAHSVEESVLENFKKAGGGKFGEALERLAQSGQTISPGALLGMLRADLAEEPEPLQLLRNFAAASTPEQIAAELQCTRALLAAGADVNALDRERSTPLHHAAMSPRADLARALLDAGAKVNAQTSAGLTPLHNAALFGGTEPTEYLLDHGADPEGRAVLIGAPPLLMAVTRGDPATVTALLDHHADVNALGPDGETPLARAAALDATEVARVLIAHGARVKAHFGRTNHTPLHVAASRGFLDLVTLLLKNEADPNARDDGGFTPLIEAAERGRTQVVRALLVSGAQVNASSTVGRTALWAAAARGQEETIAFLLNHGADAAIAGADGQSPLHIAAFNARPGGLRPLLERHPALDKLSRAGTPLHALSEGPLLRAIVAAQARPGQPVPAAGSGSDVLACARLLLGAGAHTDVLDANGTTPVQTAAAFGNRPVLEEFATATKSALTLRDTQGFTLLHHAARGPILPGFALDAQPPIPEEALAGCGETVAFLIEHGVPVNARDLAGSTPLLLAASAGNLPALRALLTATADIRIANKAGATALHCAAARGRTEAVKALLAAHAPVDAADADGVTPLHLAATGGALEIAQALVKSGADPNLTNHRGQSALACAEGSHHPEVAAFLRSRGARAAASPD